MIKANFISPQYSEVFNVPHLRMELSGESINELHHILRRALNCEDPQKYKDWVELCDRLDALKAGGKI